MNKFYFTVLVALFQCATLCGSSQDYQENWSEKHSSRLLIKDWASQKDLLNANCPSDYLNSLFIRFLEKDQISTILEVGSRDAIDAFCLSEYFKARVYSFECNPEAIEICKHNIGTNPNISLIPLAVWNETKFLSFFPIIAAGFDPLIGLSSIFQIDQNGPIKETQPQREITVDAIRLDEWMQKEKLKQADLICIDVQGGTLQVLQGLGEKLREVKYIICEVEYEHYYVGQVLYPEIRDYLQSYGFSPIAQMFHSGIYKDVADTLFIRDDLSPGIITLDAEPLKGFY